MSKQYEENKLLAEGRIIFSHKQRISGNFETYIISASIRFQKPETTSVFKDEIL